jgi:hypothetical protein
MNRLINLVKSQNLLNLTKYREENINFYKTNQIYNEYIYIYIFYSESTNIDFGSYLFILLSIALVKPRGCYVLIKFIHLFTGMEGVGRLGNKSNFVLIIFFL